MTARHLHHRIHEQRGPFHLHHGALFRLRPTDQLQHRRVQRVGHEEDVGGVETVGRRPSPRLAQPGDELLTQQLRAGAGHVREEGVAERGDRLVVRRFGRHFLEIEKARQPAGVESLRGQTGFVVVVVEWMIWMVSIDRSQLIFTLKRRCLKSLFRHLLGEDELGSCNDSLESSFIRASPNSGRPRLAARRPRPPRGLR